MHRYEAGIECDWYQSSILPTSDDKRMKINVGGQIFETTFKTLRREPHSLLAALTHDDAPIFSSSLHTSSNNNKETINSSIDQDKGDSSGGDINDYDCVFFDRDWWVFRFILDYLRTGQIDITHKKSVLKEMYVESIYYELPLMREEIENLLDEVTIRMLQNRTRL